MHDRRALPQRACVPLFLPSRTHGAGLIRVEFELARRGIVGLVLHDHLGLGRTGEVAKTLDLEIIADRSNRVSRQHATAGDVIKLERAGARVAQHELAQAARVVEVADAGKIQSSPTVPTGAALVMLLPLT
jgi:hypothetical protein